MGYSGLYSHKLVVVYGNPLKKQGSYEFLVRFDLKVVYIDLVNNL